MTKKTAKTFQDQIFQAMKSADMIFPVSEDHVSLFDHKFGNTKVFPPSDLSSSRIINTISKEMHYDDSIKMAAFSKGEDLEKP